MVDATANKRPRSNWAQITSAWVGVVAIVGVAWQAYAIRQNFSESSARQVYMSYSESVLKYPEFTEPDLAQIKKDPVKYVQYKSFVSHMLSPTTKFLPFTTSRNGARASRRTSNTRCRISATRRPPITIRYISRDCGVS
jgi:hypothetical protein